MIITLSCPGCGKRYDLDRKLAGKKARCKHCRVEFRIPVPMLREARPEDDLEDAVPAPPEEEFDFRPADVIAAPASRRPAPPPLADADEELIPASAIEMIDDVFAVASSAPSRFSPSYDDDDAPPVPPRAAAPRAARDWPEEEGAARSGPNPWLVVLIAVPAAGVGVLLMFALLLPAVRSAREAAIRARERNEALARGESGSNRVIPGENAARPDRAGPGGGREAAVRDVIASSAATPEGDEVQLVIRKVQNLAMYDILRDKIRALADGGQPNRFHSQYDARTKVVTCRIGPVSDPRAAAARIAFGTRVRLKDRSITLDASPPTEPELMAWRRENAKAVQARQQQEQASHQASGALPNLRAADVNAQREALRKLQQLPPQALQARRAEIARALEPILQSNDRFVRADAAKLLASVADAENVPALLRFLEVEDFFNRREVMDRLIALKDPRCAEVFAKSLARDRNQPVAGLIALGPAAEPAVLGLLAQRDEGLLKAVCDILKAVGSRAALPGLAPLVAERNGDLARSADEAIEAIEEREGLISPAISRADRSLARLADATALSLANVNPAHPDRDRLYRGLELIDRMSPNSPRRGDLARPLASLLAIADRGMRGDVARRLVALADRQSVPALVVYLQDQDPPSRNEVMEGLGKLQDPAAAPVLASWLPRDRDPAARALIALGPGAERAVVPYLTHQDRGVREKACEILGQIGTRESVPMLRRLAQGPDQDLARAAANALQAMSTR